MFMSSELGKMNISKTDSVNPVSSTSKLMQPPPPRAPKNRRNGIDSSRKKIVAKRRHSEDKLYLHFPEQWLKEKIYLLGKKWDEEMSENPLALLAQVIDSTDDSTDNSPDDSIKKIKEKKKEWIKEKIKPMYNQEKRRRFIQLEEKRMQIHRNEVIANTLSMGRNDQLKKRIIRILNKCIK